MYDHSSYWCAACGGNTRGREPVAAPTTITASAEGAPRPARARARLLRGARRGSAMLPRAVRRSGAARLGV